MAQVMLKRKEAAVAVAVAAEATPPVLRVVPGGATADDLTGIVHILTCGSVDDGKSTLIGRLLWDATDLYDDQRLLLERSERRAADSDLPDFSLLVDGLVAEREQGITIDIAWRYFDAAGRRFVVIDSPGHEQYTRNMASGASHADVAILLIDARHGIKRQTRRHAAILDLVGVSQVILAVNKMDLVDWSEQRFSEIAAEFKELAGSFAFGAATAIPVCAVTGDNVAFRSEKSPWFEGPFLLEALDEVQPRGSNAAAGFRFPVQTVLRDGRDFRGLAGTVRSGSVAVGDRLVVPLSGRGARVKRIVTMGRDLASAGAGEAVALQLDADIDVSRGAVLCIAGEAPIPALALDARLVWLSETPFDPRGSYLLRTATDLVPVSRLDISSLVDLATMAQLAATGCAVNDIADVRIELGRRTLIDRFRDVRATGSLVLVADLIRRLDLPLRLGGGGASLAAGVVTETRAQPASVSAGRFLLSRDMLSRGLCSDLGGGAEDRGEFERRLTEVALILRAAGVDAVIESSGDAAVRFDPVI